MKWFFLLSLRFLPSGFVLGSSEETIRLLSNPPFFLFMTFRAADVNEELSRLRPPRFLNPDGITRSYIRYQADGDSLLQVYSATLK